MSSGELLFERSFVKGEHVGVTWEIWERIEGFHLRFGSGWVKSGVEKR